MSSNFPDQRLQPNFVSLSELMSSQNSSTPLQILQSAYIKSYADEFSVLQSSCKNLVSTRWQSDGKNDKGDFLHSTAAVQNATKNRFDDILPYDDHRITVEGRYINATPLQLGSSNYIATQAPLPETRKDFWEMAWEANSKTIVMLTKFVEGGKKKADLYWPKSNAYPLIFDDLSINLIFGNSLSIGQNENGEPIFVKVSELMLIKGKESKYITHYHLENWPDGDVISADLFHELLSLVENKAESSNMIVHCSAGVGRAGVFIAAHKIRRQLDSLLKSGKPPEAIFTSVPALIVEMRAQRAKMVQTKEQYRLIYDSIRHFLIESNHLSSSLSNPIASSSSTSSSSSSNPLSKSEEMMPALPLDQGNIETEEISRPIIRGQISYQNGIYEGEMTENRIPHGEGVFFFSGHRYTGSFFNGKFHGQGELLFSDGSVYQGPFVNDVREGDSATFLYKNSKFYMGPFKQNVPDGQGVMIIPGFGTVTGQFFCSEIQKFTEATLEYEEHPDIATYHGQFNGLIPHGLGICCLKNGDTIEVQYNKGSLHAIYQYIPIDASIGSFRGNFIDYREGGPTGRGTKTLSNGYTLKGHFVKGILHNVGEAALIKPNGDTYRGSVDENEQPHGHGVIFKKYSDENYIELYRGSFVHGIASASSSSSSAIQW